MTLSRRDGESERQIMNITRPHACRFDDYDAYDVRDVRAFRERRELAGSPQKNCPSAGPTAGRSGAHLGNRDGGPRFRLPAGTVTLAAFRGGFDVSPLKSS